MIDLGEFEVLPQMIEKLSSVMASSKPWLSVCVDKPSWRR